MAAHKLTNRLINSKNSFMPTHLLILLIGLAMCIAIPFRSKAEEPAFILTRAQKGVRITTDVVAVALPVAALATTLIEQDWEGLKEGAFTATATAGATLILKYSVKEKRPDYSNTHSFPSGHTAVCFAAATYIGRRYGWKWSIPAYALSTYTAWGRVYGRKHYWWDVAAGAAIGAASAMIFTRPYLRKHEAALIPTVSDTSAGFAMSFSF